ncbi:hypothetical protein EVAR_100347_1 [Eumeta japonica]|uniref:Uncharacterized protein n=1 Tax=Eumeta variegata TaxID=151549 RepID=A0A4C2ACV0_EUMVA|nr:hypothetical protein EVAR_100347_1 [Eumeta japonica]
MLLTAAACHEYGDNAFEPSILTCLLRHEDADDIPRLPIAVQLELFADDTASYLNFLASSLAKFNVQARVTSRSAVTYRPTTSKAAVLTDLYALRYQRLPERILTRVPWPRQQCETAQSTSIFSEKTRADSVTYPLQFGKNTSVLLALQFCNYGKQGNRPRRNYARAKRLLAFGVTLKGALLGSLASDLRHHELK